MSAQLPLFFACACVRDTISESDARFLIGYSLLRYVCAYEQNIRITSV